MSTVRRFIIVLALCGLPVNAVEPGNQTEVHEPTFWASLGEWLQGLWADVGCSLDPDGRCVEQPRTNSAPADSEAEVGCSLDPSGRCLNDHH